MTGVSLDPAFLAAFRTGTLTESQAEQFVGRNSLELKFLLLQLSVAIANGSTAGPHTPSGAIPPYEKPTTNGRKAQVGAQPGHAGSSRPTPPVIDRRETHELPACPCCGGQLVRTGRQRTRVVEDLPENLKSEVTEHTIHRDWCPKCRKQVEPKVPDALPNSTLGNRTLAFTAWLHFGLGTTTSQIVEVLNGHLKLKVSDGGLTEMWHRLAGLLHPWYEQIRLACVNAPVLHADETGWRVAGETWWLWCAATPDTTYYWIDASRGHDALREFFLEEFAGILVTDFWKAYDAFAPRQQKCWAHLLREIKEVSLGPDNAGEWPGFAKRLKRIYADAVRLKLARDDLPGNVFDSRVLALHQRMTDLACQAWTHPHARRLAKRLRESGESLLTFVECHEVPATNNHAEREVRPAVLMRKASYGSVSEKGAATRSVLMSIYRTLKQRGLDPLKELEQALQTYITTRSLPPLPDHASS